MVCQLCAQVINFPCRGIETDMVVEACGRYTVCWGVCNFSVQVPGDRVAKHESREWVPGPEPVNELSVKIHKPQKSSDFNHASFGALWDRSYFSLIYCQAFLAYNVCQKQYDRNMVFVLLPLYLKLVG